MKNKGKLKVLMELRPCFEGFAGIPQETRLVFRALNRLDEVEATGLINHPGRQLRPGLSRGIFGRKPKPHQAIYRLSRLAMSVKVDPMQSYLGLIGRWIEKRSEIQISRMGTLVGRSIKTYSFDATNFGDFVWQTLFSKTLSSADYELVRAARYANIRPSWDILCRIAMRYAQTLAKVVPLPLMDTSNYDVFLSQTPWPTRVSDRTLLAVRYHDAIPIFLPHTISNARMHQATHLAALETCRKRGLFICTSQATRSELLKVHPSLEKRAVVVPDIVSHEYFEEKASVPYVMDSIRDHIHPVTEPKFLTSRDKERFYERHLNAKPHRFLLMVSTLEPRKNHAKLIAAWKYLKNHGYPDLKLVIIGDLGWDYARLVESLVASQEKGELFHLYRIPSGQLRILYRTAAAVVCPSVAEGFDLSGIEAMLCGGAVAASDIEVHREIYGNACEYFNPYSVTDLAKAVEKIISSEMTARREEMVQNGLRHAARYQAENIQPLWRELFGRIAAGEFATPVERGS